MELGLAALKVAKCPDGKVEDMGRRPSLAQNLFKAVPEVLSMRAQYFSDVTEQGMDMARQMSFLVEQGHEVVLSQSYRSSREALTSKLETESGKQLAKARLQRARCRGASQSGWASGPSAEK